jgi:tetratricopeptide (TPR) repeat protein
MDALEESYGILMPKGGDRPKDAGLRSLIASAQVALAAAKYGDSKEPKEKTRAAIEAEIAEGERNLARLQSAGDRGEAAVDPEAERLAATVTLHALGQLSRQAGKLRQARDRFQQAAAQSPGFFEAYYALGDLYIEHKGAVAADWAGSAERMLQEARRLNPERTEATLKLAQLYVNKVYSRYQAALDLLAPLGPDVRVSKVRAEALRALRRIPEALVELETALPLNRNDKDLRTMFVAFALAMPDLPESAKWLGKARKILVRALQEENEEGRASLENKLEDIDARLARLNALLGKRPDEEF